MSQEHCSEMFDFAFFCQVFKRVVIMFIKNTQEKLNRGVSSPHCPLANTLSPPPAFKQLNGSLFLRELYI